MIAVSTITLTTHSRKSFKLVVGLLKHQEFLYQTSAFIQNLNENKIFLISWVTRAFQF